MSLSDILKTYQEEKKVVEVAPLQFVEKDKDGISLKGVLQRGRLKLRKGQKARKQGVNFRPSAITFGFCERLKVGQLAGLIDIYDESPTPKLQLIFDFGSAVHEILQGYFWDIGILKGSYACSKCQRSYHNLVSPTACPSEKANHKKNDLTFKEVKAESPRPSLPIRGRCDGILVIDGEESVLEVKTIANRTIRTPERQVCFEDLDQPKMDHVIQINLYMWMLGIDGGHLLYVGKNDHQIKTFFIQFNYELIRPYIENIERLVGMAEELKKNTLQELPPCCGNEKCPCHQILSRSAA